MFLLWWTLWFSLCFLINIKLIIINYTNIVTGCFHHVLYSLTPEFPALKIWSPFGQRRERVCSSVTKPVLIYKLCTVRSVSHKLHLYSVEIFQIVICLPRIRVLIRHYIYDVTFWMSLSIISAHCFLGILELNWVLSYWDYRSFLMTFKVIYPCINENVYLFFIRIYDKSFISYNLV